MIIDEGKTSRARDWGKAIMASAAAEPEASERIVARPSENAAWGEIVAVSGEN
jgi:hypothetical protein